MDTTLLRKLINANGISGREGAIRNIIKQEIRKYVDEVRVDKVGNLIAHKRGKGESVMLAAHMDEVGLIISEIRGTSEGKSEDGQMRILPVGGLDPIAIVGHRVRIGDKVGGVVTTKEMSSGTIMEAIPSMQDLYIDTGLTKRELEARGVEVGSYASFEQCGYCNLGSPDHISGKAIDDRMGCFMLVELAKRMKKSGKELYYVFTVQEEISKFGAKTSAYSVSPDWAIVVDVTDGDGHSVRVGKGPYILIKDAEVIGNTRMDDWLKRVAKRERIPLQYAVSDYGATDALGISLSKGGIPTAITGVPVKNIHSAVSLANLRDIQNGIKLLEAFLKNPPRGCKI